MKRRLFTWLSTILERLLLLVDGHAPTQIRMKAVQVVPAFRRISYPAVGNCWRLVVLSIVPHDAHLPAGGTATARGHRAALHSAHQGQA